MPDPIVFFVALYGLILGSFFNVLVWRIPRGESIVTPGSRCPQCGHALTWYENIPLASYLALRGKCSVCKSPISWRYPLVEAITGAGALVLWHELIGPLLTVRAPWWTIGTIGFSALVLLVLIPLSLIDIDHFLLPFVFTIPILATGAAISFVPGAVTPLEMILGAAAGAGPLLAIGYLAGMILKKEAMGGGDIWLMAGLGAWFGWQPALLTIMFGSCVGAVVSLVLMPLGVIRKDHTIPFGPFLSVGAWIAVTKGQAILDWYLGLTLNLMH